jgi:hypothetical protein
MADTRRLGSQRTRTKSSSAKVIFSLLLIVVGAGVGYGYFPDVPAPVGERGDRIDFSSLATVVTIDEYAASQIQGLSSEFKDDKLGLSGLPVPLATTSIVKANFGAPAETVAADLSALVAEYGTKLQHHLDSGWNASAAMRGDLTSDMGIKTVAQASAPMALVPAALGGAGVASGRVSRGGSALGGRSGNKVGGSISGGSISGAAASLGGRGGVSGLAP